VSTPAFGVTSFTINPNVIPSNTSSTPTTKAESIPTFTSQFSLEAPVSVLPPAISSFSVTSIVNPLEDLSALPSLGSISEIAAPGIAAPGTVSTPSSGAGGITAPSDSSAGVPSLPRVESPNGNVSSVAPPITIQAEIKQLDWARNLDGDCVELGLTFGLLPSCTPTAQQLEDFNTRQKLELKAAMGGDEGDKAKAELARFDATKLAMRVCKNDATKCGEAIASISSSDMYKGLTPKEQIRFWKGISRGLSEGKLGKNDLINTADFMNNYTMSKNSDGSIVFTRKDSAYAYNASANTGADASSQTAPFMLGGAQVIIIGGAGGGCIGLPIACPVVVAAVVVLFAVAAIHDWWVASETLGDAKKDAKAQAAPSTAAGSPDPNDPCGKQSFKDLGSNSRADSAAQRSQFENAHDFKRQYVGSNGSQFNMVIDKITGRIWLEPLQGGPSIPTEYNKSGDYIGERKPLEGKC
jgi:hypothetical protein